MPSAKNRSFEIEAALFNEGYRQILGIDEAGRGALIGPVVVAGLIFPYGLSVYPDVRDSKQLSAAQRENLRAEIEAVPGIRYAFAVIEADEIDRLNIFKATMIGFSRVAAALSQADYILADGNKLPVPFPSHARAIVKGDDLCRCIGGASILAKTERDRIMDTLSERHPQYGFAEHKGYGTESHVQAIRAYGVLPEHRRTFEPVKTLLNPDVQETLF